MASKLKARLRERADDRKAALEKKRAVKEKGQRAEESHEYFTQHFAEKKTSKAKLLYIIINIAFIQHREVEKIGIVIQEHSIE